MLVRDVERQAALAFRAARRVRPSPDFAAQSFWWTIGGEGYPPLALAVVGLPPPTRFADMLTGAFAGAPAQREEPLHGG